jgi:hypothetical protein
MISGSSTNHEAPNYAGFSGLVLLRPSFVKLPLSNNLLNFQTLYGNLYTFSTQIKFPFSTVTGYNKMKDVIFQCSGGISYIVRPNEKCHEDMM